MSRLIHVILSGGVGSRLWPVSRKSMPKQYIPLFGGKSLFELTLKRNQEFSDHTIIVGNKDNYHLSRENLQRLEIFNYSEIIEAAPRNTAAAVAFSAFSVRPDDILLVTPSDHIITNSYAYSKAVYEAINLASDDNLVTFGIAPAKPETGYGYIEFNQNDVLSFREKPNRDTASLFVQSGNFLWNSGMFCIKAKVYLEELDKYEPEIYFNAKRTFELKDEVFLPAEATSKIPSKSIDYAVMERSKNIKVVKADFGWSDLGSFESIWEHWENQGESERFMQNNCVIGSNKHIEFLGVDNLILVETEDAILVLSKESSQDVKKIYEKLEREKPELVN